ncbi:hypothetical protein [Paenibacillus glycanilyticus]|uniref:Flavodoxin n=1 Tax=Paenibacillus glycanilyticus TaxID=126569 RepID=A0ABQ6GEJ9_9BACL|nr:hypothetical protein [Paenibacillus glycanilyticus]GLX68016.1 hypothetical protein MU1_23610 [Paenibacillus glycanilyticus]
MSYVLSVYVPDARTISIIQCIEDMKKLNTEVEIHPDFSFENQSGFLPFKLIVTDCPNESLNQRMLLSGFEMSIETIKNTWIEKLFRTKKRYKQQLIISISSQDPFEMRLAWYWAAVITKRYQGLLIDEQEGDTYQGQEGIEIALQTVKEYEQSLSEENWKCHEFEEWL